jgi:hypothetical protein
VSDVSVSDKAQAAFNGFQRTSKARLTQCIAQINVQMMYLQFAKAAKQKGNVECGAVEGHQDGKLVNKVWELVQIVAVNESMYAVPIVHTDHCDLCPRFGTRGFDVQVCYAARKIGPGTPVVAGG